MIRQAVPSRLNRTSGARMTLITGNDIPMMSGATRRCRRHDGKAEGARF